MRTIGKPAMRSVGNEHQRESSDRSSRTICDVTPTLRAPAVAAPAAPRRAPRMRDPRGRGPHAERRVTKGYAGAIDLRDLRVHVLGGFDIEGVASHQLGSRKARRLLKILALARGRPVSIDSLIEALWAQARPARPEDQVLVLVSRLRAVLGAERLARTDAGYSLHADWLDLDAVASHAVEAGHCLAAGSHRTARASAEAALALARGPVLPEEPEAIWVEAERAAAERLLASIRHTAARRPRRRRLHRSRVLRHRRRRRRPL